MSPRGRGVQMSAISNITGHPTEGSFYVFRLRPHDDLKQSIINFAVANHIRAGAVVACVGSLEQATLRFANQPTGTVHREYFEIASLSGTFSETGAHLHACVSDQSGSTIAGHLLDGNLVYTTAEIVVVDLAGLEFAREIDATYGYRELVVKKKDNVD